MVNLIDILPPTEEDIEIAREVSKLLNIPVKKILNETIEDIEEQTNYKNKPIATDFLSVNYVARHHTTYPVLTKRDIEKMYEHIQNF